MDTHYKQEVRQRLTDFYKTLDVPPVIGEINDLVNQQAWQQAEQEEKRAMVLISQMWQVVQAVATASFAQMGDYRCCEFCSAHTVNLDEQLHHQPDCVVLKAVTLVNRQVEGKGQTE